MAGFLSMTNLARIAKVIALLLFVLPWVTVSCADQVLVSMSGVDLITGNVHMAPNAMGGAMPAAPDNHGGDLLVIIGAVLIVLALVATFLLKGRNGALAGLIGSALAAVTLGYAVLVRVAQTARADATASSGGGAAMPAGSGGPTPEQIAQMVKVNVEIGFYLCLAALIAAVVFDFLAMQRAGRVAVAAEPPPAP